MSLRSQLKHLWLLGLCLMVGCSPRLDWREVHLETADLRVMFPCKPDQGERAAPAAPGAAAAGRMGLASCEAAGLRFALSWAEIEDPAQITAALRAMPASLAGKLQARQLSSEPLSLPGATANEAAVQLSLSGRQPDGRAAKVNLAVFTRGRTVYQLMVLGPEVPAAAWEGFLGSIRLGG